MNDGRERVLTYAAGLALTAVVASPARQYLRPRSERVDGFPLSHYPMFSAKRAATGKVTHLLGVDTSGEEHILHYRHAGIGGLNQVRRQITRRVREGGADELAAIAARSVASSTLSLERRIRAVQVVMSKFDYDDFYAGERTPRSRRVLAESVVQRGASTLPLSDLLQS